MKIMRVIILMLCLGAVFWGAKLIYSSFVLEKEITHIIKYGEEVIPEEAKERYVKQSLVQLLVQLGLVILGTIGTTWVGLSVFKTHNKKLQNIQAKNTPEVLN